MACFIRWLSVVMFVHVNVFVFAQHDHITLSLGPVIPIGKDLAKAYSMGMRVEIGPKFKVYKIWNINPVVGATMYANSPESSPAREALIFYSTQLRISRRIGEGKITVEPIISAGYNWGSDYVVNKDRVFPGNYFDKEVPLLTFRGFIVHAGAKINLTKRLGFSADYQFSSPYGTLSAEVKKTYPGYGSNSLYGPVVYFDKQKFKMGNLSLNIWVNL